MFCQFRLTSKHRVILILPYSDKTMAKILMFNFKGDRNARSLVEPLVVCFCIINLLRAKLFTKIFQFILFRNVILITSCFVQIFSTTRLYQPHQVSSDNIFDLNRFSNFIYISSDIFIPRCLLTITSCLVQLCSNEAI